MPVCLRHILPLCFGAFTLLTSSCAHSVDYPDQALARITVYDAESCPFGHHSATGVRLRNGIHCAVDPRFIPYGSHLLIPGLGERIAVDTGSDVLSRKAARLAGSNAQEQSALVVDIFVDTKEQASRLEKRLPLFARIQWIAPQRPKRFLPR